MGFNSAFKGLNIKIYRTIIFPAILYGCETRSVTLREERRLRVFGNRVLRIFGLKRDEVKRGMEKTNCKMKGSSSILPTKRYWGDQIKQNLMDGDGVCMGERRGANRILVGRPEGKIPLGRLWRIWEYIIIKNLQEVGWRVWTGLIWLTRRTGEGFY